MEVNKEEAICTARGLFEYIRNGTSPFHVVETSAEMLAAAGFTELDYLKEWNLKEGGKYYIKAYGKTIFAFTISSFTEDIDFHIAAAHTDHPCLHVKPRAELGAGGCQRINTEVYGGPILNTWMDRPLSAAGSIAIRSRDIYHPEIKLLDVKKPILIIPNLAIHMNKDVNQGVPIKKQTDMLPLFSGSHMKSINYFTEYIADLISVKASDILDFDLYVYVQEAAGFIGTEEELVSSPRLDNLTSCYGLLKGIIGGKRQKGINLIALYDNEEIGSRSKQGADSYLLYMIIEKLCKSLNMDKIKQNEAVMRSFLFSVDTAHALHPGHIDKYDPVNISMLNGGVTIKISCSQKYTFDSEAIAITQQLCKYAGVKFEKFVNNSDMPGGGTLGPIISSYLPIKTVDIGIPLLAMHSARELMGTYDQLRMEKLITAFFSV